MKIKIERRTIDLNKFPYRGILSEIARERGVSRQAVQQAMTKRRAETLALIAKKVKQRTDKMNGYKRTKV
jgi:predicted DNA-binding protein YlxM (UPF0122 family)